MHTLKSDFKCTLVMLWGELEHAGMTGLEGGPARLGDKDGGSMTRAQCKAAGRHGEQEGRSGRTAGYSQAWLY